MHRDIPVQTPNRIDILQVLILSGFRVEEPVREGRIRSYASFHRKQPEYPAPETKRLDHISSQPECEYRPVIAREDFWIPLHLLVEFREPAVTTGERLVAGEHHGSTAISVPSHPIL